jgi:hypothetical protein
MSISPGLFFFAAVKNLSKKKKKRKKEGAGSQGLTQTYD